MGQLLGFAVGALAFAGWFTHVVTCLKFGLWGFLIAGALVFPIGIVHGWGLWLGFF